MVFYGTVGRQILGSVFQVRLFQLYLLNKENIKRIKIIDI